jgi:hypothetical protein
VILNQLREITKDNFISIRECDQMRNNIAERVQQQFDESNKKNANLDSQIIINLAKGK